MKKNKNNTHNRRGLTMVEMMIAVAVLVIVFFGVSGVLARNQRLWNAMYSRIYSDVFTNGQLAKILFDSTIRKSSDDNLLIDSNGAWVEAYYYANDASVQVDRYTRFFYQEGALFVQYGNANPKTLLSTQLICDNVTDCVFGRSGCSVYMLMTLNDGYQTEMIVSSAEMHN